MNGTLMAASRAVAFIFVGVLAGCGFTPKDAPMPDASNAVPVNRVEPDTRPWTEIYPAVATRAPNVAAVPVSVAAATPPRETQPVRVSSASKEPAPDARTGTVQPTAKPTPPATHKPASLLVPIPVAPANVAAAAIKRSEALLASTKKSMPAPASAKADPVQNIVPVAMQWESKPIEHVDPGVTGGAEQFGNRAIVQSLALDHVERDPILIAATASVQVSPEAQFSGLQAGVSSFPMLASNPKQDPILVKPASLPGHITMRDLTPSEKLSVVAGRTDSLPKTVVPELTWSASAGMLLSDALRNWGEQATPHWAIVWNASELRIGAPFSIKAHKFLDAARQLLVAARREHHTFTVISHPNHVLVVTTPTE